MELSENTFRTALVGGFNRQDVLDYIEASARQARDRSAALRREADTAQKDLDAARKDLDTVRAENRALQERSTSLEGEVEALREQLSEAASARDAAQGALEALQSEAEALRTELAALRETCAQYEEGARAYDELKDRTATIELEARRRAQSIEEAADERARRIHAEADALLGQVQSGYVRLREDVRATLSHASGELGRVEKALSQVLAEFSEHDAALERLLASCREAPPKEQAPDPLPLEDPVPSA